MPWQSSLYLIFCKCWIQFATHQWIQGYLRKTFCWFSREVFELEIRPIPIFASSFQGLSDKQVKFSLRPAQQLTLEKHDFEPIIWLIIKLSCLWEILKFFSTKFVPIVTCFEPSKDISKLVLKTAARVLIHFSWFFNKIEF